MFAYPAARLPEKGIGAFGFSWTLTDQRRLLADSTGTPCPSSLEIVERDFLRPVSQTSSDE